MKQRKASAGAGNYLTEVVLYGGLPVRRCDVYQDVLKRTGSTKAADLFTFGPRRKLARPGAIPLTREELAKLS